MAAFIIFRILVIITALVLASQTGLNWDTTPLQPSAPVELNSDGTLTLHMVTQ